MFVFAEFVFVRQDLPFVYFWFSYSSCPGEDNISFFIALIYVSAVLFTLSRLTQSLMKISYSNRVSKGHKHAIHWFPLKVDYIRNQRHQRQGKLSSSIPRVANMAQKWCEQIFFLGSGLGYRPCQCFLPCQRSYRRKTFQEPIAVIKEENQDEN